MLKLDWWIALFDSSCLFFSFYLKYRLIEAVFLCCGLSCLLFLMMMFFGMRTIDYPVYRSFTHLVIPLIEFDASIKAIQLKSFSLFNAFSLKVKVPKYERLFVNSDGCTFVRKFPHPRGLPTLSENVVKFSDYAEIFFQL